MLPFWNDIIFCTENQCYGRFIRNRLTYFSFIYMEMLKNKKKIRKTMKKLGKTKINVSFAYLIKPLYFYYIKLFWEQKIVGRLEKTIHYGS